MIRFEHFWVLWLLLLIPVWIGAIWFTNRQRRKASYLFVSQTVLQRIAYSLSWGKLHLKSTLWVICYALLIVGFSDPQVGTKLEEVKREGIDVIIAVDVSNSMLCEDIRPSRLESAKHEILKFINGLKGDRIGLIAFAGSAINYCPLTTDYGAAKLLVNSLKTDVLPDNGTSLSSAFQVAKDAFNDQEAKSKVLLIISDGEDHEENAVSAAKDLAETGVKIYAIGLGSPQGAPIPIKAANGSSEGFKKDKSGQVVMTRLDEITLQRIADAGSGKYLRGSQSANELETIWSDISSMEKREMGKKQFTAFEDRFQYLVFPALLLLLIEFFVSERKGFALGVYLKKGVQMRMNRKEKVA